MIRAGDIVIGDFPRVQGIKRRPAVVVSSDQCHQSRPDVIVGLVTSQIPTAPGATDHILIDWRAAGLNKSSAFRAFLVTLPRAAISSSVGTSTGSDANAIFNCVRNALAI